jgi:hypothetical protein
LGSPSPGSTQKSRDFNGKPNSMIATQRKRTAATAARHRCLTGRGDGEEAGSILIHTLWPGPSDGTKQVNQFM